MSQRVVKPKTTNQPTLNCLNMLFLTCPYLLYSNMAICIAGPFAFCFVFVIHIENRTSQETLNDLNHRKRLENIICTMMIFRNLHYADFQI